MPSLTKICRNIQSNLGDSNADFSKTTDFSNLTVSPDLFCYHLMLKYYRFFEFRLSIFRIKSSVPIKEIPIKIISKFEVKICQTQSRMITFFPLSSKHQLLHTRLISQVLYFLHIHVIDTHSIDIP